MTEILDDPGGGSHLPRHQRYRVTVLTLTDEEKNWQGDREVEIGPAPFNLYDMLLRLLRGQGTQASKLSD